jgi:hypothetical protein
VVLSLFGSQGLGGLDIFKSKIDENNFLEPQNVGEPLNSSKDDFAFMIDAKTQIGFSLQIEKEEVDMMIFISLKKTRNLNVNSFWQER